VQNFSKWHKISVAMRSTIGASSICLIYIPYWYICSRPGLVQCTCGTGDIAIILCKKKTWSLCRKYYFTKTATITFTCSNFILLLLLIVLHRIIRVLLIVTHICIIDVELPFYILSASTCHIKAHISRFSCYNGPEHHVETLGIGQSSLITLTASK